MSKIFFLLKNDSFLLQRIQLSKERLLFVLLQSVANLVKKITSKNHFLVINEMYLKHLLTLVLLGYYLKYQSMYNYTRK